MTYEGPVVPPLPPFEPRDARAIHYHAERRHRMNVGLIQDFGHIGGWLWAVVRWPFRLVARLAG